MLFGLLNAAISYFLDSFGLKLVFFTCIGRTFTDKQELKIFAGQLIEQTDKD